MFNSLLVNYSQALRNYIRNISDNNKVKTYTKVNTKGILFLGVNFSLGNHILLASNFYIQLGSRFVITIS